MGISSKKQKTTGTTTAQNASTATTATEVPDWIKTPQMQNAGAIAGLIGQGPGAFAPQISGLQQQAFDAAAGLKNSAYLGQAGQALGNIGDATYNPYQASSLLDGGLDKYFNPYKDQVLNPVLDDYDAQSGQTRAAQAAAAAKNRAFQGSRYGIQEAQTEGQLARGRAATEGGLLSDMYSQATGLAGQDAAARNQAAAQNAQGSYQASATNQQAALQRAQQLAALGISEGAETRANLGVQAGLGGVLTDAQNAQAQYPIQYAGQMNSLLAGLNPELYSNRTIGQTGTSSGTNQSTTTSNPGLLAGLGQAAQIAALFPSDGRLKTKIKTLFKDWKGRRWVEYAYKWAPDVRKVGVIAQELLRTDPQAVHVMPGGYLAVDYGDL